MDTLISLLSNAPILAFPDLSKPYILHVDASTTGLGAVLLQYGEDKKLHPVCYGSRSLKSAEFNYPPHKLEFLALKWAVVDKFNFYLYVSWRVQCPPGSNGAKLYGVLTRLHLAHRVKGLD